MGVALDATGVYVAGITGDALPGQVHVGGLDVFVRKYDFNGTELWTRQFGTPGFDLTVALTADSSGVYVGGQTNGTLPGQTSSGDFDAFVRKYDPNGTELWTRQFGTASFDAGGRFATDASGVYVVGRTQGTLPGQTSSGDFDAFVRKYDPNGTELWTRQFGTASSDMAFGVAAGSGGVYVVGWTRGTLPSQTSSGDFDAFVRKYDPNGTELWTRQFGTTARDSASVVTAEASGVYVAGEVGGTLPGQVGAGGSDAYVRRYDSAGSELWTRQFGSAEFDTLNGITVDSAGIYVAGDTSGALPGQVSSGDSDGFVRKSDLTGSEVWTRQFGTASRDGAFGIAVHSSGVYASGSTHGTLPGQISSGAIDAFLISLSNLTPKQALQELIADVVGLNLKQGISNSLDAKLEAAVQALDDLNENNNVAAINALIAFMNYVEAQRGIHITDSDANDLINQAQQLIATLGG